MTQDQISRLAKLQVMNISEHKDYPMLYHYTTMDAVRKKLSKDCIKIRLTNAEDFEDQHEGRKTIEVYYDLALERMLRNGIITSEVFAMLANIEVPDRTLFFSRKIDSSVIEAKSDAYNAYVFCFCIEENNDYMIEHYIRNDDHSGYCMSFFTDNICEDLHREPLFGERVRFSLKKISYGNEIVDMIYNYMVELVSIPDQCDASFINRWGSALIRDLLSSLRYNIKLKRYSQENEVRLCLLTPASDGNEASRVSQRIQRTVENGKRYVYFDLVKNSFDTLTRTDSLSEYEDVRLRESLSEYYPVLCGE